jgi:DNA-binding NarL/FixJ family response regulator
MLINSNPEFKIVEISADVEALRATDYEQLDVIILDLDLVSDHSINCLRDILSTRPPLPIIVLTATHDLTIYHQAIRLGVSGVVLKNQDVNVLFTAIRKVTAGEIWLDRVSVATVLAQMTRQRGVQEAAPETAKIALLTSRERQLIMLIGEGLTNRQIAERLVITETTVRHHLTSIYQKLAVKDRLSLALYAYQHGLAKVPRSS